MADDKDRDEDSSDDERDENQPDAGAGEGDEHAAARDDESAAAGAQDDPDEQAGRERDDERDGDDADDEGDGERDDEGDGEGDGERDDEDAAARDDEPEDEEDELGLDRAHKAASALGVAPDQDAVVAKPVAPKNRAERRRAQAMRRRRGQKIDEDEAPRDRNLKKRQELLERRKRAAASSASSADEPSDVSLAVDDALARGGAAAVNWLKRNWKWMQWALVAGIVGGVGTAVYLWRAGKASAAASDALAHAVAADQAVVVLADKDQRSDEEKKQDKRLIYASYDEKNKAALERYQAAASQNAGSGSAILARLGLAGVNLDRQEWDAAIAAYEEVLRSKLAAADADVKGRALEGLGFAYEGKKDVDKALATFGKLADVAEPTFTLLAKYHRARLTEAKGDKDEAKKLFEEARKEIENGKLDVMRVSGGSMNPYRWLSQAVEESLRRIDPASATPKFIPSPGGAGGTPMITPEQARQLLQQRGAVPGLPLPK